MIAAAIPLQRPAGAKLLAVDRNGTISHGLRSRFLELLRPGDLVVANDAATLPASLFGTHVPTGKTVEVRLAGRNSLEEISRFTAIAFGEGDFRVRTENRANPPALATGDALVLGPLRAKVVAILNHPRLITLQFEGSPAEIWEGFARYGRPIQYAHIPTALELWDIWTPIAGTPAAFEPPSAGFVLDWRFIAQIAMCGVEFATLTHTAGISSTGDRDLDALLPFPEPYRIPPSTARAIQDVRRRGGRVVAIGTTVVRALEHAARADGAVNASEAMADQRIGPHSRLCVVDAILSGTHEPDTSHYELLGAFADEVTLRRMSAELNAHGYRTHEFGDSVFLEKAYRGRPLQTPAAPRMWTV